MAHLVLGIGCTTRFHWAQLGLGVITTSARVSSLFGFHHSLNREVLIDGVANKCGAVFYSNSHPSGRDYVCTKNIFVFNSCVVLFVKFVKEEEEED